MFEFLLDLMTVVAQTLLRTVADTVLPASAPSPAAETAGAGALPNADELRAHFARLRRDEPPADWLARVRAATGPNVGGAGDAATAPAQFAAAPQSAESSASAAQPATTEPAPIAAGQISPHAESATAPSTLSSPVQTPNASPVAQTPNDVTPSGVTPAAHVTNATPTVQPVATLATQSHDGAATPASHIPDAPAPHPATDEPEFLRNERRDNPNFGIEAPRPHAIDHDYSALAKAPVHGKTVDAAEFAALHLADQTHRAPVPPSVAALPFSPSRFGATSNDAHTTPAPAHAASSATAPAPATSTDPPNAWPALPTWPPATAPRAPTPHQRSTLRSRVGTSWYV
jgi:hypothetical protein